MPTPEANLDIQEEETYLFPGADEDDFDPDNMASDALPEGGLSAKPEEEPNDEPSEDPEKQSDEPTEPTEPTEPEGDEPSKQEEEEPGEPTDDEPDPTVTPTGEGEPDNAGRPNGQDNGIMIPKHRFDEINARMKRSEQELAQLRAQNTAATPAGPSAEDKAREMEAKWEGDWKQHAGLMLEGKIEEAAKLARSISDEQVGFRVQNAMEGLDKKIEEVATKRAQAVTQQKDWNTMVSEVEAAIPELNQDDPAYDPILASQVLGFTEVYERTMDTQQALDRAVVTAIRAGRPDVYTRLFPPAPAAQEEPTPPAAPTTPTNHTTQTQKQAAVSKAAAVSQPAVAPTETPSTDDEFSAAKGVQMTEEEFDALPEATKARMRGDVV